MFKFVGTTINVKLFALERYKCFYAVPPRSLQIKQRVHKFETAGLYFHQLILNSRTDILFRLFINSSLFAEVKLRQRITLLGALVDQSKTL